MTAHRIDFATLTRPRKPNTFLLAPEGLCKQAKVDKIAPVYPAAVAKLRQEFLAVAIAQPRLSHTFEDEAGLYDDFVARSALFGFPDHVSVKFLDVKGGKSTLAVYSRSVYGRSDFGVNRARTLAWLALVSNAIKPQSP